MKNNNKETLINDIKLIVTNYSPTFTIKKKDKKEELPQEEKKVEERKW